MFAPSSAATKSSRISETMKTTAARNTWRRLMRWRSWIAHALRKELRDGGLCEHRRCDRSGLYGDRPRPGSGANSATRWFVTLEKQIVGGRQSGIVWRAFGEGTTQANAETQALADLNGKRRHRYGGAADSFGVTLTPDVN